MQIQPIDITQIIVSIITTAGVIYAARQRRRQRESPRPEGEPRRISTWTIVMGVSLILLATNLGGLGWRYWLKPEVEITYPYNGATVEIREMVRGTSQKIPEGQAIWIMEYPITPQYLIGRYYPQDNPVDVQANGDWVSLTYIGIEEDVNCKFDIIAVLADKRAQDAFNAYLKESEYKKTWPGLERLPEGTTIYDRITVTRK